MVVQGEVPSTLAWNQKRHHRGFFVLLFWLFISILAVGVLRKDDIFDIILKVSNGMVTSRV
jgi:hypothetical protein